MEQSPLTNRTDLAERLQTLEDHLNQLQDQLVRAQRLSVLGTMATMIAHEFNNLLTPVVSYSQYALNQDDPTLWHKALTRAYESGAKASEVAQQLLGFSRGSGGDGQADVNAIVDATLKCLVRDLRKDNIEVVLDLCGGRAAIQGHLLQQVLYNLIINARQAMLGRPGRLTIRSTPTNQRIEISVADSGKGIDPEVLPKIFDPFFTTKTDAERPDMRGTGLGLAISRNIIEDAGGTLTVESEPDKGTQFTIVLPSV